MRLRRALDSLATDIWKDVTLVRASPGPWKLGEVTVTERLHLALLRSNLLAGLVVYQVPNETRTGADWEWLVQVPSTQSFLRYRLQAKILDPRSAYKQPLRFGHLDHPKGTGQQRSTLLAAAKSHRAIPYYAFYVGDPWPTVESVSLPPVWATRYHVPVEQFGCTAVPAQVVENVRVNAKRPKLAANQYLSEAQGIHSSRLSDLFPGASLVGGPPDPNTAPATELSPDETALLEELRVQAASGRLPVAIQDLPVRERERELAPLRMTAFFTL